MARSSQSEQQGVENTLAAIAAAVEKVPRKWDGVQVSSGARGARLPASGRYAWSRPSPPLPFAACCWCPMQAVFLKTADSVALPMYQVLPDAPTRIDQ